VRRFCFYILDSSMHGQGCIAGLPVFAERVDILMRMLDVSNDSRRRRNGCIVKLGDEAN